MLYGSNIERLKRDCKEIKHHIKRVEKAGDETLAYKFRQKYEYLTSFVEDIQEETTQ